MAEFMEIIAQSPGTKAMIIARIEASTKKQFAEINERNEKAMVRDGCSQEAIDWVREQNDAMLWPTILQSLQTLGINLAYAPERKH